MGGRVQLDGNISWKSHEDDAKKKDWIKKRNLQSEFVSEWWSMCQRKSVVVVYFFDER